MIVSYKQESGWDQEWMVARGGRRQEGRRVGERGGDCPVRPRANGEKKSVPRKGTKVGDATNSSIRPIREETVYGVLQLLRGGPDMVEHEKELEATIEE